MKIMAKKKDGATWRIVRFTGFPFVLSGSIPEAAAQHASLRRAVCSNRRGARKQGSDRVPR
jgi:hypothetical protein